VLSVLLPLLLSQSLCTKSEHVAFSCELKNKKSVSLCVERESKLVRYRFGKKAKTELEIVDLPSEKSHFSYAHYFRAQVDRTTIRFVNADTTYVLFSFFDGEEKPKTQEGIEVIQGESRRTLSCASKRKMDFTLIEHVPCDSQNELGQSCDQK
jgi:hypothetical protein